MKMHYDKEEDALYIELSRADVLESEEVSPGVILDYDAKGNVVGLEVLGASKRVNQPAVMEQGPVGR